MAAGDVAVDMRICSAVGLTIGRAESDTGEAADADAAGVRDDAVARARFDVDVAGAACDMRVVADVAGRVCVGICRCARTGAADETAAGRAGSHCRGAIACLRVAGEIEVMQSARRHAVARGDVGAAADIGIHRRIGVRGRERRADRDAAGDAETDRLRCRVIDRLTEHVDAAARVDHAVGADVRIDRRRCACRCRCARAGTEYTAGKCPCGRVGEIRCACRHVDVAARVDVAVGARQGAAIGLRVRDADAHADCSALHAGRGRTGFVGRQCFDRHIAACRDVRLPCAERRHRHVGSGRCIRARPADQVAAAGERRCFRAGAAVLAFLRADRDVAAGVDRAAGAERCADVRRDGDVRQTHADRKTTGVDAEQSCGRGIVGRRLNRDVAGRYDAGTRPHRRLHVRIDRDLSIVDRDADDAGREPEALRVDADVRIGSDSDVMAERRRGALRDMRVVADRAGDAAADIYLRVRGACRNRAGVDLIGRGVEARAASRGDRHIVAVRDGGAVVDVRALLAVVADHRDRCAEADEAALTGERQTVVGFVQMRIDQHVGARCRRTCDVRRGVAVQIADRDGAAESDKAERDRSRGLRYVQIVVGAHVDVASCIDRRTRGDVRRRAGCAAAVDRRCESALRGLLRTDLHAGVLHAVADQLRVVGTAGNGGVIGVVVATQRAGNIFSGAAALLRGVAVAGGLAGIVRAALHCVGTVALAVGIRTVERGADAPHRDRCGQADQTTGAARGDAVDILLR